MNDKKPVDIIKVASVADSAALMGAIADDHLQIIYELVRRLGGEVEVSFPLSNKGDVDIIANSRKETLTFKVHDTLFKQRKMN